MPHATPLDRPTRRRHHALLTAGTLLVAATSAAAPLAASTPRAAAATTPYRVLFDAAHAETAGNADWVISTSQPDPLQQNPNPTTGTSWTGGVSSWGVALQRTGRYSLATLPAGQTITYGGGGALDLSNFDELVLPEPNTKFTAAEKTAIMTFVQNGGGLFMIADHNGSDRNNDGIDSLAIFNDLMTTNSVDASDPFGISFDVKNISKDYPSGIPASAATDPIMDGPFGTVSASIIASGTTETVHPSDNPAAKGELYVTGASTSGTTGVFFASSGFGSGRVAAWGDSSTVDDGTCSSGNTCYDGWDDHDDAALALNATEWLVGGSSGGSGGGGGGATEQVTNGGFESGATGWSWSSSGGYALTASSPVHSGSASAWLCGYDGCSDTLSQSISIPSGTTTAAASWYVEVNTTETSHAYDYLKVQLRSSSGAVLKTLATYSDASQTGAWLHGTASLASYAGQTVRIAFVSTNDASNPTDFYVDDVSVQTS